MKGEGELLYKEEFANVDAAISTKGTTKDTKDTKRRLK